MNYNIIVRKWYYLFLIVALIAVILGISSGNATAGQQTVDEFTHKVFAPPGVLDTGIDGVELWHDYGSFALYRVTDAAWQSLPADIRAGATLADNMDGIMIEGFTEATDSEAALPLKGARGVRGSESNRPWTT